MIKPKVITFGEIMLRLAPYGYYRLFQNNEMEATFGGSEANVAVCLANFGIDVSFVTKLPENPIGNAAICELKKFDVDIEHIVRGGDRVGIYYMEKGASQRGSICIYDRKHSSLHKASIMDFNWNVIFQDANWFHFTGITPALGENLIEICKRACMVAKKNNITISCDLNYRKKLWDKNTARKVMTDLCEYVDVCILNEEDAKDIFGIEAPNSDVKAGNLDMEGYKKVVLALYKKFNFKKIALTLRTSISANYNKWAGLLYDGKEFYYSKEYDLHIVDRVGGGDSFAAGFIYASLCGANHQKTIDFSVATSALKHSIEGDFNRVSIAEVEQLLEGDVSGRVQR